MLKLPCRSRFIVICRALGSSMARKAVPVNVMYKVKVTRKAACGIELQSLLQQRLFSFLNCEQCVETCLSRGQAAHHERTEDGRHRGVEKERKNYWIRNVYRINRKCCQVGAQMYRDITRWRKCHWKWEIVNAAETKCAHLVARCYKVVKRKSAHAKIEISLLPELNVSSCSPEAFTPITHPRIK